jgi:hypothetical protein
MLVIHELHSLLLKVVTHDTIMPEPTKSLKFPSVTQNIMRKTKIFFHYL